MKRLDKRIIQLAMLILIVNGHLLAKDPGIEAFYKGDYKKAGEYYDARLKKDKDNEKILYNSGTTAFAQKDTLKAKSQLMQSLATDDKEQLAKAHYNLGQLAYQEQNANEALEHFMKSMIYDPDDPNAKIMYEHIRQQQQQQQQQQKQDQNQDQNKDQDKKQDQQQDQQKQDQGQNQDKDQQQQQDKNQDQDQKKQDQDQNQQQQDQQQQDQQQQQSQLSEKDLQAKDLTKEQAKNILNAMKDEEKESMKKLILSQTNGKKIKRSKEW